MTKSSGITLLVLFLALAHGCKKKETAAVDNETQSVVDNAIMEQEFLNIFPMTHRFAVRTKGLGQNISNLGCDTLQFISGDTADFDPDPVYSLSLKDNSCPMVINDGKMRAGFLKIRFTGKVHAPGSQMIIKLSNYSRSDADGPERSFECDSIIATNIYSGATIGSYNVKLVKGKSISSPAGVATSGANSISYDFDGIVKSYLASDPASVDGAFATFTGKATGENRHGRKFSTMVSENSPLVKKAGCFYISKGVSELTPEGFKTRTVDYGSGICDDDATFLVNGNTIAFKLK